jgi:hypothetical protein
MLAKTDTVQKRVLANEHNTVDIHVGLGNVGH